MSAARPISMPLRIGILHNNPAHPGRDVAVDEKQFMNRLNVLAGNANVLNQMPPVSRAAAIIMDQLEGRKL